MNKIYSLLGIGLLSAATLSSCKEDIFIEHEESGQQGQLQTYTAIASIDGYEATEKDPSTRANVQEDGKSFMWNTDDAVTIWNGTAGFDFKAVDYDESEPSKNVVFTGNGSLQDGATVWGIYPKKDSPTAENALTFSLDNTATQSADKPELQSTMHMLAKGTVNGTTVTNLNFEHLTALFHFSVKNLRSASCKIKSIVVTSDAAIFPKALTVAGEEKTYSDKVNTLTLTTTNLNVAPNGGTSNGYISFFPTQDVTGDTKLTFTATVQQGAEAEETIVKEGKLSELYGEESVVATDGYKYLAGKRYGVSFSLIAELGYEQEGNNYLVKKEAGLINLASEPLVMSNADAVIKLDTDLDFTGKTDWAPVTEFKGTLDGNGKTITGLKIAIANASTGFIVTNSGTIKKLKFKDASFTGTMTSGSNVPVGTLVGTNAGTGKIQDCAIEGGTFIVPANCLYGGMVGLNNGTISNCCITNVSNFTCENAGTNVGGIVGKNMGTLEGSYADNVTLTSSKGTIGGLVGWNNGGSAKIVGCYSLANIILTASVNSGLLAGGCNYTHVIASFAVGSITAPASVNASRGGLVNQGSTMNGCYSIPTFNNLTGNPNTGGISGKGGGGINPTNCYFVSADAAISAVASAAQAGTDKLATNADLVNKLSDLNANAKVAASGYEFVINEGANKDKVPLLIQKKQ